MAGVIRVLADLAPDHKRPGYDVSGGDATDMAWIGGLAPGSAGYSAAWAGDPFVRLGLTVPVRVPRTAELEALQLEDALDPGLPALRIGWLWAVGAATVRGEATKLLIPILSRPVLATAHASEIQLEPIGAWDLWSLIDDPSKAAELEASAQFPTQPIAREGWESPGEGDVQIHGWVDRVLAATGLGPAQLLPSTVDPGALHPGDGVTIVKGFGVYIDESLDPSRSQESLRAWSVAPGISHAAMASLYLGDDTDHTSDRTSGEMDSGSPFPLTDRQREVLVAARTDPVVVVSGPPGTGKSHTAAAVALDAVRRGQSVLVATQSRAAADVLAELLDRVPGPTPVLFGGGDRASKLAAKLADGLGAIEHPRAWERRAAAEHRAAELGRAVVADLDDVAAAAAWQEDVLTLAAHSLVAPRLLDPPDANTTAADVARATALVARSAPTHGWLANRRRTAAERQLRELVGAAPDAPLDTIGEAVAVASARARAARAGRRSTVDAAARWAALREAERDRRIARGEALADEVARRTDSGARRAVAALSTALRGGRAGRRRHLAAIDVGELTTALPLWVGTLGEIESLLPPVAGAFDVVVLDEASQIDQVSASAALLRAKRVVVIGDPRQLRFVSFLADADVSTAVVAHGCQPLADRLDVRRVSAFDLAASTAPVRFLDEHFRSVPHLIGFSSRHFYDDRLLVATRHPSNEAVDAIDVLRVDGAKEDGVNVREVDAAIAQVRALLDDPEHPGQTIGIVSPYRAQVDAIRERIGAELPIEVIETGRLRVGTVHGFQGAECDVAVASFGISDGGGRGRQFLEDPHLFNVLVTRARRQVIVLASVDSPPPGLLADYLRWAEHGPAPDPGLAPNDEWTARLAGVLRDAGTPVRTGYPVGRWRIDLVVGTGPTAVAVATRVHPDGPGAHIRRHLALARAGWHQAEAFPSDHDGDPVATALALGDLR
jgi:hypothetical protein